jgi:hypothetical protein
MSNTAVDEKDIPKLEPIFHGAPDTVEQAIERIMELEMRLEDLSRACEIAGITGQLEIVAAFRDQAEECLTRKITIEQPSAENLKITVVTGEVEASKLENK